jgi:endonuclease/exonuclease/phosphatase family metal-dependent hydrolase
MNTLRDIYYNEGEIFKKNNPFHMNEENLTNYVMNYNIKNNTNYKPVDIINNINHVKSYKGFLYPTEYTREGEIEFLKDFCNVKNNYEEFIEKQPNTFRLVSYNVHSFINSCNTINKEKNTRNIFDVLNMYNVLRPDIIAIQEYSPVYLEDGQNLNVMNFINYYKNKIDNKMTNHVVYEGIRKKHNKYMPEHNLVFLGNMMITSLKCNEKYKLSMDTSSNSSDARPFIGMKINIGGKDLYIFNIHPISEKPQNEFDPVKSENYYEIMKFVDMIYTKFPPNKYNIIICGDFNNNDPVMLKYMKERMFRTVHNLYDNKPLQFTGYHGVYLDFIFISLHFMYDFTVVCHNVLEVNYSDHYPVMMDFKVNDMSYKNTLLETMKRYFDINYLLDYNKFNEFKYNNITDNENNLRITPEELINKLDTQMPSFLDIDTIIEIIGGNIVTLPKDTYIVHGTDSYNKDTKTVFELNGISNIPMSFTFLHYPNESFMSWYGLTSENSLKRLLIFKTTKDIKFINLFNCGTTLKEKINCRLDSYMKLYNYFRKIYDLPDFDIDYKKNKAMGFNVMRLLWIIVNHQLLVNINNDNNKYNPNLFYGMIIADTIMNDSAIFVKNINHDNTTSYWHNNELYEGLEIQLFTPAFFTEFCGVYYNDIFHTVTEWREKHSTYINKIENVNIGRPVSISYRDCFNGKQDACPNNFNKNKIIKKNIKTMFNFMVNIIKSAYYNENIDNNMSKIFNTILNKNKYNDKFIINMLLNDFLLCLSNTIYFAPGQYQNIKDADYDDTAIYNKNDIEELYYSFGKYILKQLSKKIVMSEKLNNDIQYIYKCIIYFVCHNKKKRLNVEPLEKVMDIINMHPNDIGKCINEIKSHTAVNTSQYNITEMPSSDMIVYQQYVKY